MVSFSWGYRGCVSLLFANFVDCADLGGGITHGPPRGAQSELHRWPHLWCNRGQVLRILSANVNLTTRGGEGYPDCAGSSLERHAGRRTVTTGVEDY